MSYIQQKGGRLIGFDVSGPRRNAIEIFALLQC